MVILNEESGFHKGLITQLTLLPSFYSEDLQLQEGSSDPRWVLRSQTQAHFSPHPFVYQLPSPVPWFPHWRVSNPRAGDVVTYNCRKYQKIGISSLSVRWLCCCWKRTLWAKTWMYFLLKPSLLGTSGWLLLLEMIIFSVNCSDNATKFSGKLNSSRWMHAYPSSPTHAQLEVWAEEATVH